MIERLATLQFCFNPHPPRREGATSSGDMGRLSIGFQSSPPPKGGCNAYNCQ